MLRTLRPRSVYDVLAALAFVIAVAGGTAYAANTIGSEDIIDESILSQDIKNGQVTRGDIAANAINSSRVADGALTGTDIAESTLGQVPSAATAGSAPPSGPAGGALTDTYPSPRLAESSVGRVEVDDGSLTARDLGVASGSQNVDLPPLALNACTSVVVHDLDIELGDFALMFPSPNLPDGIVFVPLGASDGRAVMRFCNTTRAELDAPLGSYGYLVIAP